MLFLVTLCFASASAFVISPGVNTPQFDSKADDCCALAWEPVIDSDDRRFIPSTAIPFSSAPNDTTLYFARRPDLGTPQAGAIDDRVEAPVYIYRFSDDDVSVQGWTNTYVLSNPNDCQLIWQDNQKTLFNRSSKLEWPSLDGYLFAKINDGQIVAAPRSGGNGAGIDMRTFKPSRNHYSRFEALGVDCAASLRKTLEAELFDIEFDAKALMGDEGQKILSLTEVINDSDFDQEATINLESEVESSLEMSHETQLYSMMDTKWGVHGSIKTGWIGKIFGLHVNVDGGYDSHSLKTNFTQTGKVAFDSQRKQFKYNEKILVKARSKSKVTMNTQPIAGSQSFKAYYRIKTTHSNGNLALSQVKNSLRRQGFLEWNSLTQDKSGDIIFTVLGHMDVDAGVDTHILIESSPLGNRTVSVNSTRLIKLDSLPGPPDHPAAGGL